MSKLRKTFAVLLAIALVVTMVTPAVFAQDEEQVNRVSGANRYETSAAIATKAFPNGSDAVIVVNGLDDKQFADGLAASVLAGAIKAPILLTDGKGLHQKVVEAIEQLKASKAYVLGGTSAVSEDVFNALKGLVGDVERISIPGGNREDTAAAIARKANTGSKTAYVVNGYRPADAMVAGAAAFKNGNPILLVNANSIPKATSDALKDLGIENVIIVGGTAVVSQDVQAQLQAAGYNVKRLSGSKRALTAVDFAKSEFGNINGISVVNGGTVGSLSDAVGASVFGNPILFAEANSTLLNEVSEYIDGLLEDNNDLTITLFGGTSRLTTALQNQLEEKVKNAAPKELKIESVTAIGAKKIEVEFNKAVEEEVEFSVTRGNSITVNVSEVTFNAAKTKATIELATKLIEAEYTVTVTGATDEPLTAKFSAENERVDAIEILSDLAVLDRDNNQVVTVGYKVYNQYGEDITAATSNLEVTAGKGVARANPSTGVIRIESDTAFTVDEKVALSIIHPPTTTFASKQLTVSDKATVAEIEIEKLYHADGEKLDVNSDPSEFYLVINAKDQYGSDVPAANIADDVVVTVSNTNVVNVSLDDASRPNFTTLTIDGKTRTVLQLAGTLNAGKSDITIISRTTGYKTTFTVEVLEAPHVDTITLYAPDLAVAGETIVVPFEAIDQFGNVMKDASALNRGVNSMTTSNDLTVGFVQDYVKNEAKLVIDATRLTSEAQFVLTIVTGTNKVAQLTIKAEEPAEPTVIVGTKDFVKNYAEGGSATLTADKVIVKDQYGRTMEPGTDYTLGDEDNQYQIAVSSSDPSKVGLSATVIDSPDASITFNGREKGSSTITLKLQKRVDGTTVDITNSEYTFKSTVVEKADIKTYELKEIPTIYEDTDYHGAQQHARSLVVEGVLANGTKVAVPASYYTVTVNDLHVSYNPETGKLESTEGFEWGNNTTRTVKVIVTVDAPGTPVLEQNVTVSNVEPKAEELSLRTGSMGTVEGDGVVSVVAEELDLGIDSVRALVADVVRIVDQYGVEYPTVADDWDGNPHTVVVTNINTLGGTLDTIAPGDTFDVTAITDTNKKITFKVIAR